MDAWKISKVICRILRLVQTFIQESFCALYQVFCSRHVQTLHCTRSRCSNTPPWVPSHHLALRVSERTRTVSGSTPVSVAVLRHWARCLTLRVTRSPSVSDYAKHSCEFKRSVPFILQHQLQMLLVDDESEVLGGSFCVFLVPSDSVALMQPSYHALWPSSLLWCFIQSETLGLRAQPKLKHGAETEARVITPTRVFRQSHCVFISRS